MVGNIKLLPTQFISTSDHTFSLHIFRIFWSKQVNFSKNNVWTSMQSISRKYSCSILRIENGYILRREEKKIRWNSCKTSPIIINAAWNVQSNEKKNSKSGHRFHDIATELCMQKLTHIKFSQSAQLKRWPNSKSTESKANTHAKSNELKKKNSCKTKQDAILLEQTKNDLNSLRLRCAGYSIAPSRKYRHWLS